MLINSSYYRFVSETGFRLEFSYLVSILPLNTKTTQQIYEEEQLSVP